MILRDRVLLRMNKLGLNPSSLARILREVYKIDTVRQSTIRSLTTGNTKTFRKMTELASALQTTSEWLLTGSGEEESSLQPRIVEPIEHVQFGPDTVPLLGHIKTSSGIITMGKEIGRALRHPNQQGRTDGYAVEVWDNTMGPRYAIGERAYPAKEKHPTEGQDCYIFFNSGEVVLRKFISKTDKDIIFEQLNPPKKFKRLLTDVQDVHAVLGRG